MPELPEVEVVRRGLQKWVSGRTLENVAVHDPRSIRRHLLGTEDFMGNLEGAQVLDVVRRGKFLWMPLRGGHGEDQVQQDFGLASSQPAPAPEYALVAHLGMSGQLLIESAAQPLEKHLKVTLSLSSKADFPEELRFVDQRIFGGLFVDKLVPTSDGATGGYGQTAHPLIPAAAAHIARDPLDENFSLEAFHQRLLSKKTAIKTAILDQNLVSGIGNIYADEALWLAKLHYLKPSNSLRRPDTKRLIDAAREVILRALSEGGTSFDSLYVNVNGSSGYFARSLQAYGQTGKPCSRCGQKIVRESFMNRGSHFCPRCQRLPK